LREYETRFHDEGAQLAAVGLGDFTYANLFREETGITFPLLIDEKRIAYRAAGLKAANVLHILRRDNAKARARARSAGHRQHRAGQNPFQLGADFVFGPGNRDIYAHLSSTFGDNASPEMLLDALRSSSAASDN
jgi:alkyl-hydroperoxide reductase/thiol specific antioxidant family protein